MAYELNLSKHPCLVFSNEIKEICKPLYLIGLDYFTLDRIYNNKSRIILTNRPDWILHYYNNNYYEYNLFDHNKIYNTFTPWHILKQNPVYTAAAEFNISSGLTIIKPQNKFCDFYNFGASASKSNLSDMYSLASNGLLERFIIYFIEKAAKLLKAVEKNKILLPTSNDFYFPSKSSNYEFLQEKRLFLSLTKINKVYLGERFNNEYLTKRELQCIMQLNQGKTCQEIASSLHISRRTMEVHLSHIKAKLNCETLYELGAVLEKLNITKFF